MSELFVLTVGSGLCVGFAIGFCAYFIGFALSKSLHLFEL